MHAGTGDLPAAGDAPAKAPLQAIRRHPATHRVTTLCRGAAAITAAKLAESMASAGVYGPRSVSCPRNPPPNPADPEPLSRPALQLELVMEKQAWAARVASGEAEGLRIPLSRAVPAGVGIGAAELAWAACMTSSRALSNPEGAMYLIPVIDMANHREGSPHTVRWTVGGSEAEAGRGASLEAHGGGGGGGSVYLQLVAGSDIKEGEEVGVAGGSVPRGCHQWESIPSPEREHPPLLCRP